VATLLEEHRLPLGLVDAGAVQVDVDDGGTLDLAAFLAFLKADEEGATRDDGGHVQSVPLVTLQVQVLVGGEAEQRHRVVLTLAVAPEEDGVLALHVGELGRERGHDADVVAEFRAVLHADAQVLVGNVVEQDVIRHGGGGYTKKGWDF
jgi:hypothetical protein